MPITNGIGHSKHTENKQIGLGALLVQHISIVKSVLNKCPYYPQTYQYIDLNSGDGVNEEKGADGEKLDGSPVIFLKKIDGQMKYYGHFIELEEVNTFYLRTRTSFTNSHTIYTGDSREILPGIIRTLDAKSYGLIYADPNGLPYFDLLGTVSEKLPKMDILIRYPAASAKRNGRSLEAGLKSVKKSYWIVQEPEGKHQWTFLLGTNFDKYKAWRKYGFHRVDSEDGKAVFERLSLTKDERKTLYQPELVQLTATAREFVFERAGGTCEVCKKKA